MGKYIKTIDVEKLIGSSSVSEGIGVRDFIEVDRLIKELKRLPYQNVPRINNNIDELIGKLGATSKYSLSKIELSKYLNVSRPTLDVWLKSMYVLGFETIDSDDNKICTSDVRCFLIQIKKDQEALK